MKFKITLGDDYQGEEKTIVFNLMNKYFYAVHFNPYVAPSGITLDTTTPGD